MSTTVRRIAWNAATNWIATGVSGVLSLILVRFLIDRLGREAYGLANIVFVILYIAEMADLGMRGAIGRQLAEQLAREDRGRFNIVASSAFFTALGIGMFVGAIIWLLAPWLASWFRVSPELVDQRMFMIRWYGGLTIVISMVIPVFSGVITSNNRFDLNNMVQVGANLWRAVSVLLIVGLTDLGLYGWAIAYFSTDLVRLILTFLQARSVFRGLQIRLRLVSREALEQIFRLGGYLTGFRLTDILSKQADPIIIGRLLNPSAVTLYTPGIQLLNPMAPVIMTLADQLHPLATGYHVKDQSQGLRQLLIVGTRFTVLLGVPVVVIGTIFAEPIMRLWLSPVPEIGKDYIICAQVLVLWTLVQFTQYAVGTQWTVLLGMKKLDFLFWLTLPMALVNIAASVLLVIYTDLGVVGVVIPTTIISLIRRPIVAAYTARAVGVPVRRYLAGGYGRPVIVLGILAGLAYLLLLAMPIDSLLRLGLAVALIGAGWAVLCWVIGFDAQDRARFRSVAEAAWQRVRGRPRVGCCPKCGYDLRGLTEPRCPECGTDCKVSTQLT